MSLAIAPIVISQLLTAFATDVKSWRDVDPQPRFLSVVYGMADCFNVPAAETDLPAQKDALKTRCNVFEDPDNPGSWITSAASFPTNPFAQNQLPDYLRSDRPENFYLEAVPVTFSLPCENDHPGHENFMFTTNTGRNVTSLFSNAAPANEPNELNTIVLAGHFGDGVSGTEWPVNLTVIGDVIPKDYFTGERINANGMTATVDDFADLYYMNPDAAPHLVQAILEPLDSVVAAGETKTNNIMRPGVYPNDCKTIWGNDVTHRVRVMLSGGATLDGVRGVRATDEVFKIIKSDDSTLEFGADKVFPGLADLGNDKNSRTADGDNYFDLCIKDPSNAVINDLTKVRMPCDEIKLYYPRGDGSVVNNGVKIWNGCKDGIINIIRSPKMLSIPSTTSSPSTSGAASGMARKSAIRIVALAASTSFWLLV